MFFRSRVKLIRAVLTPGLSYNEWQKERRQELKAEGNPWYTKQSEISEAFKCYQKGSSGASSRNVQTSLSLGAAGLGVVRPQPTAVIVAPTSQATVVPLPEVSPSNLVAVTVPPAASVVSVSPPTSVTFTASPTPIQGSLGLNLNVSCCTLESFKTRLFD
jgi:hypothetical protein